MSDNPNPDVFQSPSDEHGMSVDDAVESVYDDWDRDHHGIAEGERESMGTWLKSHADQAGTTVKPGLESLVGTTAVLSVRPGTL